MPSTKKQTATETTETPAANVQFRKVSRGSMRRINAAAERFFAGLTEFRKEMDLQTFIADDNGERVGASPIVKGLTEVERDIRAEMEALMAQASKD